MNQVLDFLFDKHEYLQGIFQSVILVSIIMLQFYVTFPLFLKIWLTESILISENGFSLPSNTLCYKFFLMKISSLHWNGSACTCSEKSWQQVAGEYVIISILLKKGWFSCVRVSLKWDEYQICIVQFSLQSLWIQNLQIFSFSDSNAWILQL